MPILFETGIPEKQDKFLNKRKYYRPRKMNRFLKHVVDTNEISTKEEIQAVKEVFKTLIFLKLIEMS